MANRIETVTSGDLSVTVRNPRLKDLAVRRVIASNLAKFIREIVSEDVAETHPYYAAIDTQLWEVAAACSQSSNAYGFKIPDASSTPEECFDFYKWLNSDEIDAEFVTSWLNKAEQFRIGTGEKAQVDNNPKVKAAGKKLG